LNPRGVEIPHIIIDGYNVTGIYHKDLEKARHSLISDIVEYRKLNLHDITIVFDGYKFGMSVEQVSFTGNVRVIYTRLGEKADDAIKRIVSAEHLEWIVVTGDRDIADHAWKAGSVPVPPEKFMKIISRRQEATMDGSADEEDGIVQNRKGNPFRLSKKEKAIRRVLGKL
jgi:predicted RNA-binding protein with PIN domain